MVGLLGRVISLSQSLYLNTEKRTHISNIHALIGIRNHDPSFRVSEDSSCLRPLGYPDRRLKHTLSLFAGSLSLTRTTDCSFDSEQWLRKNVGNRSHDLIEGTVPTVVWSTCEKPRKPQDIRCHGRISRTAQLSMGSDERCPRVSLRVSHELNAASVDLKFSRLLKMTRSSRAVRCDNCLKITDVSWNISAPIIRMW
jgi:hypothetical protein